MPIHTLVAIVFCSSLMTLLSYPLVGQQKIPADADYDSLLISAKQQDKPLFLVVHQRSAGFSPFAKFKLSKNTKKVLSEQFVSGMVELKADDIQHPLHKSYRLTTPIFLFLDTDGYPLLRYDKPIRDEEMLLSLIDSASTIAKGETMGKLITQYKKGIRNRSLLRKLLEQYQAFDQYTNLQVLEDYVSQLTIQELNNFETVVFLLSCGPVYESQVYRLAYTNRKMVDSLYATLPEPKRKTINSRIVQRTFREALDKNDYNLSRRAGQYVGGSWRQHYLRAESSRAFYPMEHRRLSKDTVAYVQMARNYYRSNFYQVDADSLAKLDFAYRRELNVPRRGQTLKMDSNENVQLQKWLDKNRINIERTQVRQLNFGANQLLKFAANDPDVLFDALRWMQKSIALVPDNPQTHHILAKVLYRVGFYSEAETQQRRALELYGSKSPYKTEMLKTLEAMRARSW